jgi:glycosyltransferase involved in cell wall biosynthesis
MRILIYTNVFPPMIGGIETITMELAQRLAQSSNSAPDDAVQVTVVTPKAKGTPDESELPFSIVRKPSFTQLFRLIRGAEILHVAGTDMLPLLLGWLQRKHMVVEHHGFQTACPNGQMFYESAQVLCPGHYMAGRHLQCLKCNAGGGLIYSLKRWLLTFPRRSLCLRASANVMPTAWLGSILQLPRMVTIHHGLPGGKSVVAPLPGGLPSIVFLGRLIGTKGVHILLQAVHQLRDCEFQLNIIGDGPERARLEADVRSLGLEGRVVFHGYLVADKREKVLASARIVVIPALAYETFGLATLENMLRKKVVIVSEIGALTEVIGDAGLSFPAGDAHALARCLKQVLQSDEFAEQMAGRAARRANSLFTSERMVDDHLVLYRQILGACPSNDVCT